jgi:hypothetical protein
MSKQLEKELAKKKLEKSKGSWWSNIVNANPNRKKVQKIEGGEGSRMYKKKNK